jgi:hypothetical protein
LTRSLSVALIGQQAPPSVLFAPSAKANSWEDASDLSAAMGLTLDEWQETVLRAALGGRKDGKWAAHQVGLSAPRQNGKSQLIVARALAGALMFGERKIIISAHQQGTARETFNKFIDQIEANPSLESRLRGGSVKTGVINALNRETIRFANGAVVEFKARQGNTGRGFSCDLLFLDEAQTLSTRAWATINSTMSAKPNPQVWLMGTPPTPDDDGEVFTRIRKSAIEKAATSLAWCEWAASPDDDPALDDTRAKANPAWYTRINHEVVQGEFETYTPGQFALERLGIWPSTGTASRLISAEAWDDTGVDEPPRDGVKSFGVAFSADGERVAVAGAVKRDGPTHVELVGMHSGDMDGGIGSLADWLAERWRESGLIAMSGRAGSSSLYEELRARGVSPKAMRIAATPDYFASCSMTLDAVRQRTLTHLSSEGQAALDDSIAVCDRAVRSRDGAWGWVATTEDGDETPTEAISLALWAARTTKRNPNRPARGVVL